MKYIAHLLLGTVKELDIPIESKGENIAFHQVLIASRSKTFYECTIFSAINNKHTVIGDIVTLCHSEYQFNS